MRTFRSPDGTEWKVDLTLPGSSNIMVVFRHPDGATSGRDRYNWFISSGPEARSVTSRLDPDKMGHLLDEVSLARLFSRSMPVSRRAIEPGMAFGFGGAASGMARRMGSMKGGLGPDQEAKKS